MRYDNDNNIIDLKFDIINISFNRTTERERERERERGERERERERESNWLNNECNEHCQYPSVKSHYR